MADEFVKYQNGELVRLWDRVVPGPHWKRNRYGKKPAVPGTVTRIQNISVKVEVTQIQKWSVSVEVTWDSGRANNYLYDVCGLLLQRAPATTAPTLQPSTAAEKASLAIHTKERHTAFMDQEYADVTIICGNKSFKGHKIIIASHSSVFDRMFKDDMVEAATNQVEVKEMEPDVLKGMLFYIYHGTLEQKAKAEWIIELMAAADMFNVKGLKYLCEEYVLDQLNEGIDAEDVLNVLVNADLHNCYKIKDKCIEFIRRNKQNVVDTDNWQKLENEKPKLINEVLKQIYKFPTPSRNGRANSPKRRRMDIT